MATIVTCMAVVSCGAKDPKKEFKAKVLAELKSADETERANAVNQIPSIEVEASEKIKFVVLAMDDESAKVRAAAVSTLSAYRDELALFQEKLVSLATGDASVDVRLAALSGLAEYAKDEAATLEAVKGGLRDGSLELAAHCAQLMASSYIDSLPGQVPQIANVIKKSVEAASSKPGSQLAGLDLTFSLADLGTKASAAVPILEALQKSGTDMDVKAVLKATTDAIKGRAGADKVSELLTLLRDQGRL